MSDDFIANYARDQERKRAGASTLNAIGTNPERAARAQRLGQRLGIPPQAVMADPGYETQARQVEIGAVLDRSPATASFMADQSNAEIAHDQVEGLGSLEQMLRRGVRGGADVLGNIGKSLYAGIPRTSGGVVGLTEALGDVAGALNPFAAAERGLTAAGVLRGPTSEQNRRQTSQAYRQRLMNQAAALRPQTDNALASAAYSGLESVVPSILGIAATLASGGSATPAAALLAAPVGGEAYGQARDAGKGLAPSLIYGTAQGGAEAVGERIGLGPLFDGLKVGSPFLQTFIKTQISEQLGEQATTVLQDFNEWVTLNPEKTVGQFLEERPNAALQTAIATAVGSAATTTGVYTGNRATQELLSFADRRANAQASKVRGEQFNEAADAAAGNPVRERSPERFEQFLKAAAGDEQVFVPAEQVASFFQSNPDLDQWMDEWDIRDQVNAAMVSGADVVFDQSTYLAKIAGTPAHEAWKNEIRHGLDAMSIREADEFERNGEESLRASFDAAVSVAENEAAALAPEARVAEDLFSQLRAAGYTADAARTQAALAARAFARRAERSPQRFADAYAAYENAGLTVQQEFPQVIRENLDRIDVMIEALRKGRAAPTEQRMFGRSLMEFLSQEGGVIDTGGELQALGADSWHRPKQGGRAFRRRFIRSAEQGGNAYAPDQAALRAVEAGYLPEGATGNDLFEAVREELAGRPVYSQGFERNTTAITNAAALNELEQLISQLDGVTLESSNAEIKAALERAAAAAPGYEAQITPEEMDSRFRAEANAINVPEDATGHDFSYQKRAALSVAAGDIGALSSFRPGNTEVDRAIDWAFDNKRADIMERVLARAEETLASDEADFESGTETFRRSRQERLDASRVWVSNLRADLAQIQREATGDTYDQSAPGEDQYIERINPEGRRIAEGDRPNLGMGDMYGMAPKGSRQIATMQTEALGRVRFVESGGDVYALAKNPDLGEEDVVGYMMDRDGSTELAVVNEAQGQGIGAELSYQFRSRNPFAQSGGLTEAGEATARAAYRRMTQEGRTLYQSSSESLSDIVSEADARGVRLSVSEPRDNISVLSMIDTREAGQGEGIGSEIMGRLTAWADRSGVTLALTPEKVGNTSKARLTAFYKRNGFVENKGRSRDFATRESMIRAPQETFNQNTPFTGPRGQISFSNGQAAIRLFESRDLSTFSHEFAHLTLEMLIDDAADPNASPEVLADMQTVLDWFSREAGRTITVNDIGVDQHELWARGSERYLMEGKAPSLALRDVFRTFSTWLKSIYRTLRNLNAPITDDVRAVMDRLLASDAEIEQARQTMGVEAGFETAEQVGWTGAEFEAYKARVERARKEAEDSVIEHMTRAIRRRVTAEWRTAEDELRPDVISEVDAMPDVAAVEWLVTSKQGLTKETVVDMLGDEAGIAMLPKRVPPIVRENGMHPDEVAEIVGYRNGHELLNALMEYEAEKRALVAGGDKRSVRQARIDRLLMERMLDRYGDPLNDGSIEREVLDALHSDRRLEILAAELGVLARRSGNNPSPLSAIKDWARGLVGGRPVREARSGKYLRAERTAASATQKALAAGDRQEAFKQKQAQTLNAVLYAEASRAEQYVETAVARLKRLSGRVLSIDVDYRDQIESLLEQYDLREVSGRQVQRRRSLLQFVKEREEAGEPVNVPPELLAAANKTHYSELTVDEFRALDEAVQHLAHLGRLKRKLIVNGEQRDLDRMADEAWTVAQALPDVKGAAIAGSATLWQRAVRAGAQFEASLVKAQEFFRLLDGGVQDGLFSTVLDKAGQEAATRKLDLTEAFWRPVVEAERAIPNKVKDTWTDTLEGHPLRNPQNGETVELKRRDLIGLARHTGTLSNFEKMAKGWGVIEQDADAYAVASARDQFILWLDGQMDPTEWLYVQAQWDAHERLRPEYFAAARKVEGFEPEAVEAAPLPVTSAGPLAGGYAPVSYHPDYDAQAQRRQQRDAGSIFGDMLTAGPRPDNGATNSRTKYVGPVKIALEDGRYEAEKQLTYTAYAEYVTNSLKFLRHPVVRQTMIAKLGVEAYNTFEPWIAGQVRDESVVDPSAHPMVKIARQARSNMTAAVLLGSFTVLAAQPGGLAQSIAQNGPVGMAKGVANAVRLAAGRNLYPYITGLSDFMRARVEQGDLDRDYRLAMQRAQGAEGIKERALVLSGKAIALVDFYLVSAPTWLAAYDRALVEGKDEAGAVYLADKAVRITQGGGRAIDQSGIMRANEVTKMVTFAYGWANALYNMQRAPLVDMKNGHDRMHNAVRLMAVLVLPALFDAVLSGDIPDMDDDPEEAIKNATGWFMRNVFFGAFAGYPVIREVAGGAERTLQGKYVGALGQTPMGRIGESVLTLGIDAWNAVVDQDKEVSRRWPAHVINATGLALGLPGTSQTARSFNYVQDVQAGEQNPDSVTDWIDGLLRGPQENQE